VNGPPVERMPCTGVIVYKPTTEDEAVVDITIKLADTAASLVDSLSWFRQGTQGFEATSTKRKIDDEKAEIRKKLKLLEDVKKRWENME
jgi:hypothetical protein